ncbi:MAG: aminotransferase class IV [Candidatus Omnitrophota bacterium]
MPNNLVWLNGKIISEDKVCISINDPGFLYGYGLFETMRAYKRKIFALEEHLKRLQQGIRTIDLKIDKKIDFKKIMDEVLKVNPRYQNSRLRLNIWQAEKGVSILVSLKEYVMHDEKYKIGFKTIITKKVFINEKDIISQIKSMNRLIYQLAYQEAKLNSADEALILNTCGFLSDGSRTNIFLVKKNCLFTPSLTSGCLSGITRKLVINLAKINKIKIIEKNILPEEIFKADEVFLTNSLIEIMPVSSCEGKTINLGPITQNLIKEYKKLLFK